ncbi:hypothetical protein TspCOW1_29760 [Thiohalobacter sp. COW1]|uniref:phage tail tape measure protein n=1 Tax=Thiohalobacter sp. COW1 TaxID=2795687 RepID=UPI00191617DB|nr:phage tail tape measure protein [Thiohalobacter sp. COW1]BCO32873.1 hypothetical protein TspCOW1_29760 [Thiohalobacter sp. COW1]
MAVDFSKISVQLEAESAQLRKELDKANQKLSGFERGAKKSLDNFSRAAKSALGVFTVGAVAAATRNALAYADGIDKASKAAGVGAEFLQEFRFAAEQSGVSLQGADDSLRRFGRRIGEFANSGGGPAAKALESLNIELRDAEGNLRSTEVIFNDVVRGLEGVESTAQRAALAAQLFGDDFGPKLVPLLEQGIDGINRLRQEAKDVGVVLSEDVIQNAVKTGDEFSKVSRILSVQFADAIVNLSPLLTDFATGVGLAAKNIGEFFDSLKPLADRTNISGLEEDLNDVNRQINKFAGDYFALLEADAPEASLAPIKAQLDLYREQREALMERLAVLRDINEEESKPTGSGGVGGGTGGDTGGGSDTPSGPSVPAVPDSVLAADKEFQEALRTSEAAVKSQNAEYQQWITTMEAAAQRTREMVNPMESVEVRLNELDTLLQGGFISWDTYSEAAFEAMEGIEGKTGESKEALDQLSVFAEQAARNMQDSFAQFLYKPFDDGLEGMISGFADAMQRMAAEAAAAQIFDAAGEFFDSGGGSAIGSFFSDFIPGFASGTSYFPGGFARINEAGGELVKLPTGSQIIPADKTDRMLSGGTSITVPVTIYGSPSEKDRRSATQIGNDVGRSIQRAMRRNG